MRYVVLYRRGDCLRDDDLEIEALQAAGFVYLKRRTEVQPDDFVIARYSCLPFYKEYADDITYVGAKVLNSTAQHNYITDLQNWVIDLKELTPETWTRLEDIPDEGPFVLKGGTNSRKGAWLTHMFAADKKAAIQVHSKLSDDLLIGQQPIYIRKFVPLYTYYNDVVGMPVTKEFRFFICDGQLISGAFYWSSHVDDLKQIPSVTEVPESFLKEAVTRIAKNPNAPRAYALDVGIKTDGSPIVIELNDLQQSGLSENSPFRFYRNLKRILEKTESQ